MLDFVIAIAIMLAGVLSSIPYIGPVFNILMAALFVLILAAGFVMTLVLYKPLKKGMEYALHGKTKKTLPEEKPET